MRTVATLLAVVFCLTPAVLGQEPNLEAPLETLREEHPRLVATADDFEQIRKALASDPALAGWYADVRERAEALLEAPPVRYEIPDGVRLLAVSRNALGRVYTLGLVYQVESGRDEAFAEQVKVRLWTELETVCAFKDWNPSHFLDTAEMAHAVGIGLDWLWNEWTPEQRQVLADALREKALEPGIAAHDSNVWWTRSQYNWNQVCHSGLLVGALASVELNREAATRTVQDAVKGLPIALDEYGRDGGWAEGVGYWNYATMYTVYGLAALQTALGHDFGLSDRENLEQAWQFPRHLVGPRGQNFNFADAGAGWNGSPALWWLAIRYDEPAAAKFQHPYAQRSATALDVIWGVKFGPEETDPLPLDKHFRDAGIVTMRSEWENQAAHWLAIKAGRNGVAHGQLDLGGFIYESDGVRWFVELGADNYNLPGYFGGKRWTYYRNRTEGHNTLVLDPSESGGQVTDARVEVEAFADDAPVAALNLSAAYGIPVKRTFDFTGRDGVTITDVIDADEPVDLWWFAHTGAEIELSEDGRTATLRQDGKELQVTLESPAEATFQIMEAKPLPSSPNPEGQGVNDKVRKLAIHLPEAQETTITVHLGR